MPPNAPQDEPVDALPRDDDAADLVEAVPVDEEPAELVDVGGDDLPDADADDDARDGSDVRGVVPAVPSAPVADGERGVAITDALTRYMAQLRDYPPISRERERELLRREHASTVGKFLAEP